MSLQGSKPSDKFNCTYIGCTESFTVLFDWTRHVRKHVSMRHLTTTNSISATNTLHQTQNIVRGLSNARPPPKPHNQILDSVTSENDNNGNKAAKPKYEGSIGTKREYTNDSSSADDFESTTDKIKRHKMTDLAKASSSSILPSISRPQNPHRPKAAQSRTSRSMTLQSSSKNQSPVSTVEPNGIKKLSSKELPLVTPSIASQNTIDASSPSVQTMRPPDLSDSKADEGFKTNHPRDLATHIDDENIILKCELTSEASKNIIRGKPKAKEPSVFNHNCNIIFDNELSQIKHYLDHVISQGPYHQCRVSTCRMVFLSDDEMAEHILKFHPTPPVESNNRKNTQQSKQRQTRRRSMGGKGAITSVTPTEDKTKDSNNEQAPSTNQDTASHKKKSIKTAPRNSTKIDDGLNSEDTPTIILGRLFTR